jgi:hypothetical protein
MNLSKAAATAASVFALATALAAFAALAAPAIPANAADPLKLTYAYFMNPVEIPGGKVLPPGVYAFKIVEETATNKIIQILAALPSGTLPPTSPADSGAFAVPAAPMSLVATVVAVPDYHNRPANSIVTFYQARDAGNPALRTIIFSPDPNALVLAYPAARAAEIAKAANRPVPSMAAAVSDADALKNAALRVTAADGSDADVSAAFGKPGDTFTPEPGGPRGAAGGYNGPR